MDLGLKCGRVVHQQLQITQSALSSRITLAMCQQIFKQFEKSTHSREKSKVNTQWRKVNTRWKKSKFNTKVAKSQHTVGKSHGGEKSTRVTLAMCKYCSFRLNFVTTEFG